jgi:TP901 family phage tail tape measure protein
VNLDAVLKINAKVTGTESVDGLNRALGATSKAADGAKKSFTNVVDSSAWQGAAIAATAIGVGLIASTKAAIDFESSVANVRKVVDGLESPESLQEIRQEILQLSKEMPITAEGFAEIYAAAGESGIARGEIRAFAEDVAKMSIAFDMTAADAGDSMAKMRTALGLTQPQVVSLADALNHLSNGTASTGAELVNFVGRSGAVGQMAGLTAEQTAAFGAAMVGAGAEVEVAATSFNNMIKALSKGDSATARQVEGFGRLGLSASDMAKRLQTDALGTIMDVFKRIRDLPAEMQVSTLSDIFGDEARALAPLIANLGGLETALGLVGDKTAYAGSMTAEYEARAGTAANSLQLLQNNFQALLITIGEGLLPVLTNLVAILTPLIEGMANFANTNPLVTTLVTTVVALGAAFVVAAPFIASTISVIGSLGPIAAAAGAAAATFGATIAGWAGIIAPAIAAVGSLISTVAALVAGVVTAPVLVTAAIAAVVVAVIAGVVIWRDEIAGFFTWLFDTAMAGWAALLEPLQPVIDSIIGIWNETMGVIGGIYVQLGSMFFDRYIEPIQGAWQGFVTLFSSGWNTLVGIVSSVYSTMAGLFYQLYIEPIQVSFNSFVVLLTNGWNGLVTTATGAWTAIANFIVPLFQQLGAAYNTALIQPIVAGTKAVLEFLTTGFSTLVTTLSTLFTRLATTFDTVVVKPFTQAWTTISNAARVGLNSILTTAKQVFDAIYKTFDAVVVKPIDKAWKAIAEGAKAVIRSMVKFAVDGINAAISALQAVIDTVNVVRAAAGMSALAKPAPIPMPKFAKGGYVTGPTVGLVGEAGNEYIVPEAKAAGFASNIMAGQRGAAAIPSGSSSGGGGGAPAINITTGPIRQDSTGQQWMTLEDGERMVREAVTQMQRTSRTPAGRYYSGVR